jgi:hypothetical protein
LDKNPARFFARTWSDWLSGIAAHRYGSTQRLRRARRTGWRGTNADLGIPATGVRVDLLDQASDLDVVEAEAAIERLAAAPANDGLLIRDIWLLRLRALLARGDERGYRDLVTRYREMAEALGFEGHIAWAEEMAR